MGSGGKGETMVDTSTCTSSTLYRIWICLLIQDAACLVRIVQQGLIVKVRGTRAALNREEQWVFSPRVASRESTCVIDALLTAQRACYRKRVQWGVEEETENGHEVLSVNP